MLISFPVTICELPAAESDSNESDLESSAQDELDDLIPEISSPVVMMRLLRNPNPEARKSFDKEEELDQLHEDSLEKFSEPVVPRALDWLKAVEKDDGLWERIPEDGQGLGPVVNTSLGAMSLMVYYPYRSAWIFSPLR